MARPHPAGRFFTVRAGSLVAWDAEHRPMRIPIGRSGSSAATPTAPTCGSSSIPDRAVAGWQVVALEPYGGAWLNSWLDRDLGLSGRLSVRDGSGVGHRLVRIDEPVLRVPQLAIHLAEDRKRRSSSTRNATSTRSGAWVTRRARFVDFVAERAGLDPADVLGVDLMTHDLTPSTVWGSAGEFVSAPRLDNQGTCYAGLEALLAAEPRGYVPVLALFDHEEVGSTSDHGAQSDLLPTTLERIVLAARRWARGLPAQGGRVRWWPRATWHTPPIPTTRSGTNPGIWIEVNGGPVLKVQPNLRYATDGRTAAAFELACRQAGVPLQRYEHRADLPCGSTIGPMTSARTGIPTVDVGAAQLAMHSARELMGAADVAAYSAALQAFLSPA